MLLFSDGFENFSNYDFVRKWGAWSFGDQMFFRTDYVPSVFSIVSGNDVEGKPVARKDGRSLELRTKGAGIQAWDGFNCAFFSPIKKSRTVFLGFATRFNPSLKVTIHFYGGRTIDSKRMKFALNEDYKTSQDFYYTEFDPGTCIASCSFLPRDGGVVDYTWSFYGDVPNQYNQINSNADLFNGDFHYHELGFTLNGNSEDGASSWVENRIGRDNHSRVSNIFTASPGGETSWYIGGFSFAFHGPNASGYTTYLDDVYVCNEEGNRNNTFLGPVFVRSAQPENNGSINNASAVNGGPFEFQCVQAAEMVGTVEPKPAEDPTPTEDPSYIAWEDPRSSYITFERKDDTQLFKFRDINFAGSDPSFYGLVIHAMTRPRNLNGPNTTLIPQTIINGQTVYGNQFYRPILPSKENEWEVVSLPIDLDVESRWTSSNINLANTGVTLAEYTEDDSKNSPYLTRINYVFYEYASDACLLIDAPSKFIEEQITESLACLSDTHFQRVFPIRDEMSLTDESIGCRAILAWANSVVFFASEIPWLYEYCVESFDLQEKVNTSWLQWIVSTFSAADTPYGFWVEELDSSFYLVCSGRAGRSVFVEDILVFPEPELKTNHEFISEFLTIESSYLFSGHLFVDEYLYPRPEIIWGWKKDIEDSFNAEEKHFDGFWVEQFTDQYSINDSIKTSHWRHEFFMGICIRSWQIEPIEQDCPEGNRVGQLTSQYWNLLGYVNDPLA